MKKTYITPALHVEHINVELPIALSERMGKSSDPAKTITNSGDILTKDRGEYVEDNSTFGDLW
jgi:hypothetical protein